MSAALLASAACKALDSLITIPQSQPIATISLDAQTKGGGFVTTPGAFFYRVVAGGPTVFTTAATPADTCQQRQAGVNTSTLLVDTLPEAASPLGAGAFIAMQLSGHADTLSASAGPASGRVSSHRRHIARVHAWRHGDVHNSGRWRWLPVRDRIGAHRRSIHNANRHVRGIGSGYAGRVDTGARAWIGFEFHDHIHGIRLDAHADLLPVRRDDGHAVVPAVFLHDVPERGRRAIR